MNSTSPVSLVTEILPASPAIALAHFSDCLRFETDCWDVNASLSNGNVDFVLLDVRSPEAYEQGHIDGAINLPHRKIVERTLAKWPVDTVFVVYCTGPHCNGAQKAAKRLAALKRPVKMMIGGVSGWLEEGFHLVKGDGA